MHRITSAQFKQAVKLDPAWASKLTEPMEITDYCDMGCSEITHLSPLLHFTGNSADFWGCKSLKIAEGKFEGRVGFRNSGIEKIEDLSCGTNTIGWSAFFTGCKSLKVAEGKFPGSVDFSESGIEKIGDLTCGKNNKGIRFSVEGCPNLRSIPITFNPKEIKANQELIKDITETKAFIQKKREEIVEIEI